MREWSPRQRHGVSLASSGIVGNPEHARARDAARRHAAARVDDESALLPEIGARVLPTMPLLASDTPLPLAAETTPAFEIVQVVPVPPSMPSQTRSRSPCLYW